MARFRGMGPGESLSSLDRMRLRGMRSSESLTSLDRAWNPLEPTDSIKRVRPLTESSNDPGMSMASSTDDLPSGIDTNERWWKEKTGRHFVTSKRKFVALIIDELSQSAKGTGRPMHLGRFFNIVRGGNVPLVKEVLKTLKDMNLTEELAWILGLGSASESINNQEASILVKCINYILFPFWVAIFVLITPLFYLAHVLCRGIHTAARSRITHSIELPLVFALLSEDVDMVRCFIKAGCPLYKQDRRGNNIYHYLSDLSVEEPEKAVRCHKVMCTCVENVTTLKSLITEQKNQSGMSALETIAKYGSTHFLRFIMVDRSCIGKLRLGVSKNNLWFSDSKHTFNLNNPLDSCQRDNDDDDDGSSEGSCLNMWEFDISDYEKCDVFRKQSYLLQLVSSRSIEGMSSTDVWGLLKSKLLDRWFAAKYKQYLACAVFGHAFFLVITVLLLAFVMHHGGDVDPAPLYGTYIQNEIDQLSRAGHQAAENIQNNVSRWQNTCYEWNISWNDDLLNLIHSEGRSIDNCTASALASVLEGCDGLDSRFVLSQTLNHTDSMIQTPLARKILDYAIFLHMFLDLVIRQGFLWCNYNFKSRTVSESILPVITRRFPGSYTEKIVSYWMYAFYAWFLYSNHLWSIAIRNRNSYFEKYLRLLNSSYTISGHDTMSAALHEEVENVANLTTITGNIIIVCLMLRFFHSIHALRLLPGIGIFVITTKKMAKHLLQFTVVFGIVSLAFATIFYFVMRDMNCSPKKSLGFRTLAGSLFSTYQVALGYGEYDFKININAVIAYVAYTIISIILLLNLVIAVMTTTVEELNQMPWKHALCCVERWDEILSTEVAVLTILIPVNVVHNIARIFLSFCRKTQTRAWKSLSLRAKKSFEVVYFE